MTWKTELFMGLSETVRVLRGRQEWDVWTVLLKSLSGTPCLILSTPFLFPLHFYSHLLVCLHPIPRNKLLLLGLFLTWYSHIRTLLLCPLLCPIGKYTVHVCAVTFVKILVIFYLPTFFVQHYQDCQDMISSFQTKPS